ncbi:hypothetical protein B566_EDAN013275, partial [Ephemera danica]
MSVLMQALTLVTCEGGKMILHEEVAKKVLERIDDVFLDNMKTMVEHLIAKVKPKKMLSLEANGEKLLPVMKKYVEYINAR